MKKTFIDGLKIVRIEIVPSKLSPFELKIFYADGTWAFFSRGFSTMEEAKKTKMNLMPPPPDKERKL